MPNIIPVPGRSRNIWTLDSSLYVDDAVRFVAVQGVRGQGAIEPHDHGVENLVELIFLADGSIYGGLDDPRIVKAGCSAAVPIGVTHGDLGIPSRGQWLSVKVHGSAQYLAKPQVKGKSIVHTFETRGGLLAVAFSDAVYDLADLLVAAREGCIPTSAHIMGFPLVDVKKRPDSYEVPQIGPKMGRYLGIEQSR
ncbi:MAG TPA: hypothetical protein VJG90_07175 [Candidatus Nanoarchaeia archaeon]|nr:hypothetical protein [Candidatus Nanoarchaeia archaeon]